MTLQPVAALVRNFNSVLNGASVFVQPGPLYLSYVKMSQYFSNASLAFVVNLYHYAVMIWRVVHKFDQHSGRLIIFIVIKSMV